MYDSRSRLALRCRPHAGQRSSPCNQSLRDTTCGCSTTPNLPARGRRKIAKEYKITIAHKDEPSPETLREVLRLNYAEATGVRRLDQQLVYVPLGALALPASMHWAVIELPTLQSVARASC